MSVRRFGSVALVLLLGACSSGQPDSAESSAPPTDSLQCDDLGHLDELDHRDGFVSVVDKGFTVVKSELRGYAVHYAVLLQAEPDIAVEHIELDMQWFDADGELLEIGDWGDVGAVSTPGDDGVMAATGWVPLEEKPSDVEFGANRVCRWPADSDAYDTVDVTDSSVTVDGDEIETDVSLDSGFARPVQAFCDVVFRNEAGEIIGGSNEGWRPDGWSELAPGVTEDVKAWGGDDEDYLKDAIFPDLDAIASGAAYISLPDGRAIQQ